mmetsp:Transcript_35232/g.114067  ORF Transcript_35232/g.114067 Transcript_35232/m.114067 type:complete len:264 (+) Transcript_35232:1277-2068(+)
MALQQETHWTCSCLEPANSASQALCILVTSAAFEVDVRELLPEFRSHPAGVSSALIGLRFDHRRRRLKDLQEGHLCLHHLGDRHEEDLCVAVARHGQGLVLEPVKRRPLTGAVRAPERRVEPPQGHQQLIEPVLPEVRGLHAGQKPRARGGLLALSALLHNLLETQVVRFDEGVQPHDGLREVLQRLGIDLRAQFFAAKLAHAGHELTTQCLPLDLNDFVDLIQLCPQEVHDLAHVGFANSIFQLLIVDVVVCEERVLLAKAR